MNSAMIEAMSRSKSRVQSFAQAPGPDDTVGVGHGPARPRFRPRLRHVQHFATRWTGAIKLRR